MPKDKPIAIKDAKKHEKNFGVELHEAVIVYLDSEKSLTAEDAGVILSLTGKRIDPVYFKFEI